MHSDVDQRLAAVFGYVSEPQSSGRDYVAGGETEVERGRFRQVPTKAILSHCGPTVCLFVLHMHESKDCFRNDCVCADEARGLKSRIISLRSSDELAGATQDRRTAYRVLRKYQRLCTRGGGRKLSHQICCDASQSSPGGAREMSTLPFSFIVAPSHETSTPAA